MKIVRFNENLLDACAEFWWSIYEDMMYVHRPDGYQTVNTPPIGPGYFVKPQSWIGWRGYKAVEWGRDQ